MSETDLAVLLDQTAVEVDFDVGDRDGVAGAGTGCRRRAAGRRVRGRQLVRVERLDKVVVGAELEAADLVFIVILAGQQDYGDLGALTQAAHDFETRHVGHENVQDNDVGALLFGDAQGFFAVVGDDYAEPLA